MTKKQDPFNDWLKQKSIVVCIPCLNEEVTIEKVIGDFKRHLPFAKIRVYDNNSSDESASRSIAAGAEVVPVLRKGKGFVIRKIFDESVEDLIILVDGDSTYSAESVETLLQAQYHHQRAMIVARRDYVSTAKVLRPIHLLGNRIITRAIAWSFNTSIKDALSGYRILPRNLYKQLVLNSQAFDVETELTLQILALKTTIIEVDTPYISRPKDSHSKLNTWGDGLLILKTIALLVRYYRPFFFFNLSGIFFLMLGLVIGWVPVNDYLSFKYVYHVPLALLAASLVIVAVILFGVGLILDSMRYYHQIQMKMLTRTQKRGSDKDTFQP